MYEITEGKPTTFSFDPDEGARDAQSYRHLYLVSTNTEPVLVPGWFSLGAI